MIHRSVLSGLKALSSENGQVQGGKMHEKEAAVQIKTVKDLQKAWRTAAQDNWKRNIKKEVGGSALLLCKCAENGLFWLYVPD